MMSVLMNTVVFEDCRNQWSVSRPLLGLILLNEKVSVAAGRPPGGNRRRRVQPDTRPGCERDGGQLSVSGHLEGPGQGRIPPEGPSPGASDLLQLSGHLRLAFLEPRAPTLGRWLAQQCFQLTLTPLPAPGDAGQQSLLPFPGPPS